MLNPLRIIQHIKKFFDPGGNYVFPCPGYICIPAFLITGYLFRITIT